MTLRKISKKQAVKNKVKALRTSEMHEWFRELWDEREDEEGYIRCFESGRPLHGRIYRSNTCCYDHVLEKSVYPQYAMNKKNIVIIHPDIHTVRHKDLDNCPRIKKLRMELLELHAQNKLEEL